MSASVAYSNHKIFYEFDSIEINGRLFTMDGDKEVMSSKYRKCEGFTDKEFY
jgi:hypothetical protein